MKIIYQLTDKEKEFLVALNNKTKGQRNGWSGMMEDDNFIKKWGKEIDIFSKNNLTEKKDNGWGFWRYGLNEKGLELQKEIISEL
jgi:hypothetical protein